MSTYKVIYVTPELMNQIRQENDCINLFEHGVVEPLSEDLPSAQITIGSDIVEASVKEENKLLEPGVVKPLSDDLPSTQITYDSDIVEASVKEENKLLDLLDDFVLATAFDGLSSSGFNYENLKFINSDDLELAFPGKEHTALKAELREKIYEWKAKNFPSTTTSCHSQSEVLQSVKTERLSRESTPTSDKTNDSFNTHVIDILKSTKPGENLLTVYSHKKKLEKLDRKKLLNCLAEYFFEPNLNRYIVPSPSQQDKLADEIIDIFPTETKDIYYKPRQKGIRANPTGLLFNRFSNVNRKRNNSDNAPQKINCGKSEDNAAPSSENRPHRTKKRKKN